MIKKLNFLKGIILLISFCVGGNMRAATYYVSNTGSDAANGTSQSTAWATISKINSSTINPGDFVLFQAGGTWRETLTLRPGASGASKRVTYGRYGTGNNPKLLGSDKSTSWTATGTANVWQSTASFTNPMAASYYGSIYFENGTTTTWGIYKAYTTNFSNLTAEYNWAWSGNRIYVYATTNPDTRYSTIEIAQRNYCAVTALNTASSYITIDGIDFHYTLRGGIHPYYGEVPNQTDFTVRNCNIGYIGLKGGGCAYGIEAYHSNFLVENCIITDCGRRGISFNLYEQPSSRGNIKIKNVIVRNNIFKRGQHTTSLDFATADLETGDTLTDVYFYNNIVDDHEITLTGEDAAGSNQVYFQPYLAYFNNIYVYNNVFIAATWRNVLITGGSHYYVANNTLFDHNHNITASTWGNMSIASEAIVDVRNNIIYNNIPYSSAVDDWNIISDSKTEANVTWAQLDYNLYYNPVQGHTSERGFMGGDLGYYDTQHWTNFKTDYPTFEVHSPAPADPLFTNTSTYDLSLTSASPANGKGVVLPYIITTDAHGKKDTINKYDKSGKLRSRVSPSIGAYEFSSATQTSANIVIFSLTAQTGAATINSINQTVNIEVANGTSLTSLTPTISVSSGATINPASGVAQNFTNPVTYTVTAQNGTTQTWTVTATVKASALADITLFSLTAQTGAAIINTTTRTVSIQVATGTSLTSLTPTIGVSSGATINPASGVARNFTSPVTYTVTAQSGATQTWTVTVTVQPSNVANITAFSLTAQTGAATINSTNYTVNIVVATGTSLTSLTPTIGVSAGATINPASGVARNFTSPVTYTVTAQSGATQTWTVTVTVQPSNVANITAFSLTAQTGAATINSTTRTVSIQVATGTSLTSLTPTIEVSTSATINPASGVARNFTSPVIYTVTAQNGTTQTWTVTVTVAAVAGNNVPVVKVVSSASEIKGLVYTLDASTSYDLDNQVLSYNWVVPTGFSASALTGSVISILPTENTVAKTYTIKLTVSDGIASVVKNVKVTVSEYNTSAVELSIISIVASDYETGNVPENIVDNNLLTRWSADGNNQWLVFELAQASTLSHFNLAFHGGNTRKTYFDIYASSDNVTWDLIMNNVSSCGFSLNRQMFQMPGTKTSNSYKFVKLVGHMNSANTWNSYTEFKVYGNPETAQKATISALDKSTQEVVEVYPNPAIDNVYVKVNTDATIWVYSLSGELVHEQQTDGDITKIDFQFKSGAYFIQVISNEVKLCTKKIIVR
jgi:hypothetical protein